MGIGSSGVPPPLTTWDKKDREELGGLVEALHSHPQRLREEVAQLTRSLRRAETETAVLRETLAGQLNPDCQPMATNWIQEKVWLSQEVTQS